MKTMKNKNQYVTGDPNIIILMPGPEAKEVL